MREISRAENWETVYQAFQQINFSAFDYNTIKHALIEHIKQYYPENFNDYIEDSEMVMIIELFAYISELYAYRLDLNVHENYIGTAQRKQNVLRLAQLISYSPSRNIPSRGLVKITSVSTTESVFDSRGINLANVRINWNDQNNVLWKEQFTLVMNRIMERELGSVLPSDRVQVDNVVFERYSFKNVPLTNGVMKYSASFNGNSYPMELVPVQLDSLGPYERRPRRNAKMQITYAYDGIGDSSDNTGFFFFTKQGTLQRITREFDGVTPFLSEIIDIDNVNNTDVWVNNVNPETGEIVSDNIIDGLGRKVGIAGEWESVETANLQNVVFNNFKNRNKYQIETRENDRIKIIFGDGEFGDIPNGTFDIWVRSSANENLIIPRSGINETEITMGYIGDDGFNYTASFTISSVNVISNSSTSEDLESIRRVAPSVYQSQNRMVNDQDYNSFPLKDTSILKLRTVNRTYTGHSKTYNWNDPTGTYDDINSYGEDLAIYYKTSVGSVDTGTDFDTSRQLIVNGIQPYLTDAGIITYHSLNGIDIPNNTFTTSEIDDIESALNEIENNNGLGYPLSLSYIPPGEFAKVIVNIDPVVELDTETNLSTTGTQYGFTVTYTLENSTSVETFDVILEGQHVETVETVIDRIVEIFQTNAIDIEVKLFNGNILFEALSSQFVFIDLSDGTTNVPGTTPFFQALEQASVGRRAEIDPPILPTGSVSEWRPFDSDVINPFVVTFIIDRSNGWDVSFNQTNIVVRSEGTTFWYTNQGNKLLSFQTFQPNNDSITILRTNTNGSRQSILNEDIILHVLENPIINNSINIGLSNTTELIVTTGDSNGDYLPDDLQLTNILDPELEPDLNMNIGESQFLPSHDIWDFSEWSEAPFFVGVDEIDVYDISGEIPVLLDATQAFICDQDGFQINVSSVDNPSFFISVDQTYDQLRVVKKDFVYFVNDKIVEPSLSVKRQYSDPSITNVTRSRGRKDLYYNWKHFTTQYELVNPSPTNIHDMIVITRGYYNQLVQWLEANGQEPVQPTPYELRSNYQNILQASMLSDEVVMKSGKFKLLFGSRAIPELQGYFKIVKSENPTRTDNEIINEVINITRNYFNPQYWEMGEKFFFTELASVIQGTLYTDIKSIVLVPKNPQQTFGNLYQVTPNEIELLYPDLTSRDILFVDSLTPEELKQLEV